MSISLFVLWLLVGWECGTVPRLPLPAPRPKPDPPPCRVCGRVLGAVAGVLGGWAYTQLFLPQDPIPSSGIYPAATAVGAFVAARFATDIYGLVADRGR